MAYTFTTLKQTIQDYTEYTDTTFVNNLTNMITNTENRILKLVDLDYFRKNATATLNSDSKYLNMPPDYLASFSLSLIDGDGNQTFLLQKDVNFVQEYWSNAATTGVPKYYALFDVSNFIISPTPAVDYTAELHYFYEPESITTTTDGTSWFGDNAPDALLYGCLVEAYTFMKGEADLLQQYEQRFVESIARLKNYGEGMENTDAYRTGLVRVPKT